MTLEVEQKKICKWDFGRSSRGKNGARAIIKEERGGSEVFSLALSRILLLLLLLLLL